MNCMQQHISPPTLTTFPAVVLATEIMLTQKAASQLAMSAGLVSLDYYVNATH